MDSAAPFSDLVDLPDPRLVLAGMINTVRILWQDIAELIDPDIPVGMWLE